MMNIKKLFLQLTGILLISVSLLSCEENNNDQQVITDDDDTTSIPQLLDKTNERLTLLLYYPAKTDEIPRSVEPEGEVRTVASSDWTSGFYPGTLWYAYRITGNDAFKEKAKVWTAFVEKEKLNDGTHDMGFKIFCSFGNGYQITDKEEYREVIIKSAETLSTRYNENVGAIKSWDWGKTRWDFPVIIDNMMNLELLFETTKMTGDSNFYKIANKHAITTMNNHFRTDNSSYHVVDYNPETGEVIKKLTHQGYSDESAWARGQAWGLYGFTMTYRYTEDERFLQQAEDIAAFMLEHKNLPEDKIFYWDFDAPDIPGATRDASAAAVTAAALVELYKYTQNELYLQTATAIADKLQNNYLLPEDISAPFILTHSTGNMPRNDEVDVPINYADYYFLEAMYRLQQLNSK